MSFRLLSSAAVLVALAATAPAGEIRGRVLVDGKPAAGVAVAALPFEDGFAAARREARREDLPKALASAVSRPDGTFAVAVPGPSGTPVRLALSGGTASPRVLSALFDSGGDDAGDVRLPRALVLAGRVVDERGGPVVGATVTLWPGSGRRPQDASPGLRPAAVGGDEGRRGVPPRGRRRRGQPASRGGPGVRHPGEATRPGRRPRAAGRPSRSPRSCGARSLSPTGGPRPGAPSCGSRGARRRRAGWRPGRTARSSSTARRARPAPWWPTAGTGAAPRWCWPRAPPSPRRSPSPRPPRSPGGWWTPRTASLSPACASWPGARAGSSWPARGRTAATRCAGCRPSRTACPPRTTGSWRGRARWPSPPGRRRRRTSRSPVARPSRVAWWTRRAGRSRARP